MRIRARAWRMFFWGGLLILCSLAGGLWWAYSFYTNSDTLARMVEREAAKYLPGSTLMVGRVDARVWGGKVQLTHLSLRQMLDGVAFQALRLPWLNVRFDPDAMLEGRFEPFEVTVTLPTLRLRQRQDGTWNLEGLLASPWPAPPIKKMPVIVIKNGTIELADGPTGSDGVPIFRDVAIKVEPTKNGEIRFEGTATGGDAFNRISLEGTVDPATGKVTVKNGDIARLVISETLRKRLPAAIGSKCDQLGLTAGEVDIRVPKLVYDAKAIPKIRYEATAQLRSGLWACPKLPFPINDLSAFVAIREGVLSIERAEGYNGQTKVRGLGRFALADPMQGPMDLRVDIISLELDDRLRKWTPPEQAKIWEDFRPAGRVSASIRAVRARVGAEVDLSVGVDCLDVSMCYRHFQYPLDHVRGHFDWTKKQVDVSLHSAVNGGNPLKVTGKILDPSPRKSRVFLDFEGDELLIDAALLKALPPDVRKVVEDFRPKGSVRGTAHVVRMPPATIHDDERGKVTVDANLELNDGCSIQWVGLPYRIENLTGRLELHPDFWKFTRMEGTHGQAKITGQGEVKKVGSNNKLKIDLKMKGEKLLFDDELRQALPQAWQVTWKTLNPTGSSDVDATIKVEPDQPEDYYLEITPGPSTSVKLAYSRDPRPGIDPGGKFTLPMNDVRGRFVYHNGTVRMEDCGFQFFNSTVKFEKGTVKVENSGKFQLGVSDLWARDLRLDSNLRHIMPPIMAQFALRFDDGKTFMLKGNLKLSWSGVNGSPVICAWNEVLVAFIGNTIKTGVPLTSIQGQLDSVSGISDGDRLEVQGLLHLASVSLLGQQVTNLESKLKVGDGWAQLDNISAELLGGTVTGSTRVSLDATPRYIASVAIRNADLQEYAKTVHGRQKFRGLVDGRLNIEGLGSDLHNLQGRGEAHISQGDLGELPVSLRWMKTLNLSPATKSAFDSADVNFTLQSGEAILEPIKFTGDAFSLMGKGTIDFQGALDLRLRVLYGRDKLHLLVVSDALREASGQIFAVRVSGTPAYPTFKLDPLPSLTEFGKSVIDKRRALRPDREVK